MRPEIIIHNSISLDGSLTGFMPDMELHYRIAGQYKPDAHLIGSATVTAGNEMFGTGIPDELPEDFIKPERASSLPWWIIVDSGGKLKGMLHTCRRFEYCRDVIILAADSTPADYIDHITERNYSYVIAGKEKVDLKIALSTLMNRFRIKKILTDTGMILGNLLLNEGLADELSLLIHPLMVGEKAYPVFAGVKKNLNLRLVKAETFNNGCIHTVYKIS